MAQYWPEAEAPRVGLGLGFDFDFANDSQIISVSAGPNAKYPELHYLPGHFLSEEEVIESLSTRPDYSIPLGAPRIQQSEFSRPVGPPLKMRRSFANHVPYDHVSTSEEDFPTANYHEASPHSQETEYPLPDLVRSSPIPMHRIKAVQNSIADDTPENYSDGEEEELEELDSIIAEAVAGLTMMDPRYIRIVFWAVEVDRQTQGATFGEAFDEGPFGEEAFEEEAQPSASLTKPVAQGGWLRWTCLTR